MAVLLLLLLLLLSLWEGELQLYDWPKRHPPYYCIPREELVYSFPYLNAEGARSPCTFTAAKPFCVQKLGCFLHQRRARICYLSIANTATRLPVGQLCGLRDFVVEAVKCGGKPGHGFTRVLELCRVRCAHVRACQCTTFW